MQIKVAQLASDTRSRLLEVAATRVREQGFYRTSLDEIAADASIAKATIYHHFASKTELGKALIDYNVEKYLSLLDQQIFKTGESGLTQLRKLCDIVVYEFEHGDLDKGCPICNLVSELTNINDEFRERLDQFFQAYLHRLSLAFAAAQEKNEVAKEFTAKHLATLFLSQLQGSILVARTKVHNSERTLAAELLRDTFATFFQILVTSSAPSRTHKDDASYGKSVEAH